MCSPVPVNTVVDAIRQEIYLAVPRALIQPERDATIAFAKRVQRLRWSNRKLTYYARGYAAEARANVELMAPNICADARDVAASSFRTVPASTTRFLKQVEAANSKVFIVLKRGESGELDEIILRMLKPYEHPDEKAFIPSPRSPRERQEAASLVQRLIDVPTSEISRALGLPETLPPPLGLG